ncbi:hypothetical protein A5880_000680 [Enterococcus sp. 4G2_DIV0659]|uniref:DUF2877 domain-containing protein n=1 Tax=Candidatus Enterococcus mansonii TaxID=1834181 RepID=A0A242C7L6_9ENTE|nr:hypothetical protein A5880_002957 [Enterococcus sp. 4G2_DIV0659]
MFVNARFLDQHLLTKSFEKGRWYVHSKYKNSFNIQSEGKQELVVVTTTNYPFMPNGIYVETVDFSKFLSTIDIGEAIDWEQDCLHFSKNHLLLTHGQSYSSVIERAGNMLNENKTRLFAYSNTLLKTTGNQQTVAQFLENITPFSEALQKLCFKDQSQESEGIDFLLGRGLGLTPSGDDMIVGHLAARLLLDEEHPELNQLLLTELLAENSVTTDISKHYLLCALSKRFSEPVIHLLDVLTNSSSQEQIEKAVESIIAVGHTSGVDLLAGFLTTVKFLDRK